MIEVKNLTVTFQNKTILDRFSLSIEPGSVVCIMGDSGIGKSTLLKVLMGIVLPDSGEITGYSQEAIGVVFQEERLCEQLSAIKNVMMVLEGKHKRELAKEHLLQLLPEDAITKQIRDLSGGMKRRVSAARAFAHPSELILMDEPFTGLDESNKQMTIDYMLQHKGERTLICVTHDVNDATYLQADQVVRLS